MATPKRDPQTFRCQPPSSRARDAPPDHEAHRCGDIGDRSHTGWASADQRSLQQADRPETPAHIVIDKRAVKRTAEFRRERQSMGRYRDAETPRTSWVVIHESLTNVSVGPIATARIYTFSVRRGSAALEAELPGATPRLRE